MEAAVATHERTRGAGLARLPAPRAGEAVITDHHAHFAQSLMPLALGLAVGVPCYVGYNHLVTVVGDIVLDMKKTSLDALRMVSEMEKPGRRKKKSDEVPAEGTDLFEQS